MLLFLLLRKTPFLSSQSERIQDPYAIEILVSSATFLIAFRANYGYERYWDACGDCHRMMSGWLDAVSMAATFHLQQKHHDGFKPPSYFNCHDLNRLGLSRDRQLDYKRRQESDGIIGTGMLGTGTGTGTGSINAVTNANARSKARTKTRGVYTWKEIASGEEITNTSMDIESVFPIANIHKNDNDAPIIENVCINRTRRRKEKPSPIYNAVNGDENGQETLNLLQQHQHQKNKSTANNPKYLVQTGRLDGGWGSSFPDGKSTFYNMHDPNINWFLFANNDSKGFASNAGGRTPNLYLQELVHLASLLNAVAMATLRNDVEGTKIPLTQYIPGEPWPEVDSSKLNPPRNLRGRVKAAIQAITGYDRTPEMRTKHNVSRPIPVLGGISDNEHMFLARARGPSAKVNLTVNWLSEFITREDLAGSFGKVGAPIVSRIHQFLSDGMVFYNHCRKTMFTPFPFPHAQISAIFVMTVLFMVPLLMDEYTNHNVIGAIFTFLTVTCLAGLHEVARELENPFRNVPNEIPLLTLQAMFNEGLVALFAGFHPDHYWDANDFLDSDYADVDADAEAAYREHRCKNKVDDDDIISTPADCSSESNECELVGNAGCEDYELMHQMIEQQQNELDRIFALLLHATKSDIGDNESSQDLGKDSVLTVDQRETSREMMDAQTNLKNLNEILLL